MLGNQESKFILSRIVDSLFAICACSAVIILNVLYLTTEFQKFTDKLRKYSKAMHTRCKTKDSNAAIFWKYMPAYTILLESLSSLL